MNLSPTKKTPSSLPRQLWAVLKEPRFNLKALFLVGLCFFVGLFLVFLGEHILLKGLLRDLDYAERNLPPSARAQMVAELKTTLHWCGTSSVLLFVIGLALIFISAWLVLISYYHDLGANKPATEALRPKVPDVPFPDHRR